jgi:hypothetical protein
MRRWRRYGSRVLLAELEIWHSRPIAPTRRVALGRSTLPVDPPPGFGGLLLGGIVAGHIADLDPELLPELGKLITDLEASRRIPQPRLRHRLQVDHIGLARSRHRLVGAGDGFELEFDDQGTAASQILGAVYRAGELDLAVRRPVMAVLRRAVRWQGPTGPALIAHLSGRGGAPSWSTDAFRDPLAWARGTLGFDAGDAPGRQDVQRRFRQLLRAAHPDHGGQSDVAAGRIDELAEARRILLDAASTAAPGR